jgi:hypothetical protein
MDEVRVEGIPAEKKKKRKATITSPALLLTMIPSDAA